MPENNWPSWATEEITIVPYNLEWPGKADHLIKELTPFVTGCDIFHIGSTAIEGLAAKPIIDLMIYTNEIYRDLLAEKLSNIGWHLIPVEFTSDDKRRTLVFVKNYKRSAHLHIVINYHELKEHLHFRDILRSNPIIARKYEVLKNNLANVYKFDREAYTNAKSSFIKRLTA